MRNYYKVLQVDSEAEPEVIAAAYRRLSLKYHPDTNTAADATLRMQQINEAYEVLKDPARRARYDRELAAGGSSFGDAEDWRTSAPASRPAAEPETLTLHAFRTVPRGTKAVRAFLAEPVYCDAKPFQEQTLPGGYWIDLGFEWIARDMVTLAATWSALAIAVTVDEAPVERAQWQARGPDAVILPCAQGARHGFGVTDALYIPPLPLGDHVVKWAVRFTRDVDDGWTLHPRGSELVVTSFLHIVKGG